LNIHDGHLHVIWVGMVRRHRRTWLSPQRDTILNGPVDSALLNWDHNFVVGDVQPWL